MSKDWEELITNNDERGEDVYQLICDKVILKNKAKIGIEAVELTDE